MSPTTGTTSRITSRPIGRRMPGMTTRRSSSFSIASTRCRTDCGSVPTGKGRLLGIAISIPAWLLLQIGERVARVTVPGEVLDAYRHERPAHRRSDWNEELSIVDQVRGLDQQCIALRGDGRLARGL